MSSTVATDAREHPRLAPTVIRAEVERNGKRYPGYLINLSLGGGFLAVAEPPPPKSRFRLHLILPWGVGELEIRARSVWQQVDDKDRPIGAGVAFSRLSKESRGKLRSYLDRFIQLSEEITD